MEINDIGIDIDPCYDRKYNKGFFKILGRKIQYLWAGKKNQYDSVPTTATFNGGK